MYVKGEPFYQAGQVVVKQYKAILVFIEARGMARARRKSSRFTHLTDLIPFTFFDGLPFTN